MQPSAFFDALLRFGKICENMAAIELSMANRRQTLAIWLIIAHVVLLVLYFGAAWLMWRAPIYFPSGLPGRFAVMILLNDYAGYDSPIWQPAYAVFRCFSEEPQYFKTLF